MSVQGDVVSVVVRSSVIVEGCYVSDRGGHHVSNRIGGDIMSVIAKYLFFKMW